MSPHWTPDKPKTLPIRCSSTNCFHSNVVCSIWSMPMTQQRSAFKFEEHSLMIESRRTR